MRKLPLISSKQWQSPKIAIAITLVSWLMLAPQAAAHHPIGGQIPTNLWQGLLSGLAHPVIGLDHFAFVVASGLLALRLPQGILIPLSFVVATLLGTGIHLQELDLPFAEIAIASSVIIFGLLLSVKQLKGDFSTIVLATLAILAGIFHGYAYGEAIVGAEMTPLIAYLVGFAFIQLFIASGAYFIGKILVAKREHQATKILQGLGLGISATGIAFLASAFLS